MHPLTPDECRALGALIEKALTTPAQYPLSLNALQLSINQKSNRDPVVDLDEASVLRAVDGLAAKSLARAVNLSGSRVEKFRHIANEALALRAPELSLLSELLLRGPQTVGELRSRASRMHHFESIEIVENTLRTLSTSGDSSDASGRPALVREIPARPGERATRWMQLLQPSLHPLGAVAASTAPIAQSCPPAEPSEIAALTKRVAHLEQLVQELRDSLGSS